ncbi:MAG TPA: hypothetical protein PKZ43_10210 [Bacteroidales bacterium]|nr:hypothetical protein [Bacteroidales bacterium]
MEINTAIAPQTETINLTSYNIHGQKLREGIIKIDFEKEKVIFPSGKEYSVLNDYEFTYKILKGTIKAAGGINGLCKFFNEINTKDSPFNPCYTNLFIEL